LLAGLLEFCLLPQPKNKEKGKQCVTGAVIPRQRPRTAKGFVFLGLEDETGVVNVIVSPESLHRQN